MLTITSISSQEITDSIDDLCEILKLTVDGGASIGWLPPLDPQDAHVYWESVSQQVASGTKIMLAAMDGEGLVGSVQLGLEMRENGNHRVEVQKLIVHPDCRRQGIAYQLMQALEEKARSLNRFLLVLDVRTGDLAENLYRAVGFIHVGDIPLYARKNSTEIDSTSIYYKVLD